MRTKTESAPKHLTYEQTKTLKIGDEVVCVGNKYTDEENFEVGRKYVVCGILRVYGYPMIQGKNHAWILYSGNVNYLEDFALLEVFTNLAPTPKFVLGPCKYRDGTKGRIICVDVPGLYSIISVDSGNCIRTHMYNGAFWANGTPSNTDIISNDPEPDHRIEMANVARNAWNSQECSTVWETLPEGIRKYWLAAVDAILAYQREHNL